MLVTVEKELWVHHFTIFSILTYFGAQKTYLWTYYHLRVYFYCHIKAACLNIEIISSTVYIFV